MHESQSTDWLIARINNLMFTVLWSCVPILVSVVSFATYVASGHQLTVSTAFTAIALFDMVGLPLNTIPSWIMQFLQVCFLDVIVVHASTFSNNIARL